MEKCPNCGYEPSMLTGRELEKQYKITVTTVPLDDLCSQTCLCGHHVSKHRGEGTCSECAGRPVHNFMPSDHTKQQRALPTPIADLPIKVSELKGVRYVELIECSCGATLERPNVHSSRERRKFFEEFFEEHKDHSVKRFRMT